MLSAAALTALLLTELDDLAGTDVLPAAAHAVAGLGAFAAMSSYLIAQRKLPGLSRRNADDAVELAGRRRVDDVAREAVDARACRVAGVLRGDEALTMVYQPIVDMRTGAAVGHEALARFAGGGLPDERFAEAWAVSPELGAELENLAVALGLQAVGHLPGYVSVNVSPETLLSPRFWRLMLSCAGESVVVELTEHVEVSEYSQYQGALAALRRLGIRIAVDDAGAGYAGMRHILALAPEIIKIDRTIVEPVDHDRATKEMLTAVLDFSRSHGGTVIAEGVETESQRQALTQLSFRYGQGYLFGYPEPLDLGSVLAAEAVRGV
jgi:EAL domain-containing protein (putative c-di-GMP-specific phosphodiesterase class I)